MVVDASPMASLRMPSSTCCAIANIPDGHKDACIFVWCVSCDYIMLGVSCSDVAVHAEAIPTSTSPTNSSTRDGLAYNTHTHARTLAHSLTHSLTATVG